MTKIETFDKARTRLKDIMEGCSEVLNFLDDVENAISSINKLKGQPAFASSVANTNRPQRFTNGDMPEKWSDRVLYILGKQPGGAIKPLEAMEAYRGLGWPRPEVHREFYIKIKGAFRYLYEEKKVLDKTPDGVYRLKNTDLAGTATG